jgi:hypothetical protein
MRTRTRTNLRVTRKMRKRTALRTKMEERGGTMLKKKTTRKRKRSKKKDSVSFQAMIAPVSIVTMNLSFPRFTRPG